MLTIFVFGILFTFAIIAYLCKRIVFAKCKEEALKMLFYLNVVLLLFALFTAYMFDKIGI